MKPQCGPPVEVAVGFLTRPKSSGECRLVFRSFFGENSDPRSSKTGIQSKSGGMRLKFLSCALPAPDLNLQTELIEMFGGWQLRVPPARHCWFNCRSGPDPQQALKIAEVFAALGLVKL